MKITMKNWALIGVLSVPLLITNCSEKDDISGVNPEEQAKIENAFDFNLRTKIPVTVNYPGVGLVKIYDKNPGQSSDAKVICSVPVNYDGKGSSVVYLPTAYIGKTVYATEDYNPYNPYLTEATITKDGITVNAASTKAVISIDKQNIESDIYLGVVNALPDGKDNSKFVEKHVGDKGVDLEIKSVNGSKSAKVYVSFVYAGGNYEETLYYYVYPKDNVPTKKQLNYIFTNDYTLFKDYTRSDNKLLSGINSGTSESNKGISWQIGPNGKYTSELSMDIPVGYKIGFVLQSNGEYFYTTNKSYNKDTQNHAARFTYKNTKGETTGVVYAFEDLPFNKLSDRDYNDLIIKVTADPVNAIVDPIDPIINPPYYENITAEMSGTVLFEDLYPEEGDYDMNDFISEYSFKASIKVKYDSESNKELEETLETIDYTFTPKWDGADYGSTFSFRFLGSLLNIAPIDIFTLNAGSDKGKIDNKEVTGVININKTIERNEVEWEAFDPYITIDEANGGHEVHLSGKVATNGKNADVTDPWLKKFLLKEGASFAFAMDIPIKDYQIVPEKRRIDEHYTNYMEWSKSNGATNNDWYNQFK